LLFTKGNYYKSNGKIEDAKKWYKKTIHIPRKNIESELEKLIKELFFS
jgi:hypothetical protein